MNWQFYTGVSVCLLFFFSAMVHELCVAMASEAVTNKVVTLKATVYLYDVL